MNRPSLVRVLSCVCLLAAGSTNMSAQHLQSVFIEDLTWTELRDAIAAGATTAIVFSGSVEESGPHLALGKHNFRARAYAERIARALTRTLVAPIIPAAPSPGVLTQFPGTIDIRPEIFAEYNADIVRSLARSGFTTVLLLGDHGPNQGVLAALAPRLNSELGARGTRVWFISDGYAKSTTEIDALGASRHLVADGHGGLWDTAELMAVAPQAVRRSRLARGDSAGTEIMDRRGMSGDPRLATPALGREFGDIRVRNAVAQIRALLTPPRAQ